MQSEPVNTPSEERLRSAVDELADQLRQAVTGNFDFAVKIDVKDETAEKLQMLVNFVLDAARRALAESESKSEAVAKTNKDLELEIVNRRSVEEELRQSDARMRSILDSAADGIITIDERGIVETFNRAAQEIFGYTREETIGRNISMLMPRPHREEHDDYLGRYLKTGFKKVIGLRREAAGLHKGGSVVPIDLHISELYLDERRLFTGIVRDITELKRAQEALQRSKDELEDRVIRRTEQLARAKETAEAANRHLQVLNRVNLSLLRCQSEQEVARVVTDALTEEFGGYFARLWLKRPADTCPVCPLAADCAAKQECLHLIASAGHYRRIDGGHRRVPLGAFKIGLIAQGRGITTSNHVQHDERVHDRVWAAKHQLQSFAGFPLVVEGQTIGVVAMFAQHKCAPELLGVLELLSHSTSSAIVNIRQRIAVEQASAAKSEFLANMSHELRTPLHGILSFAQFGKQKALTATPQKLLDYFEKIDTSGQRLMTLLSDLLDLAKLESGKMSFEFKTTDLRVVLRSVQAEFQSLLAERNITLEFDEPNSPVRLTLDENRMAQVIRNILDNAVKFSPEGGTLKIGVNQDDTGVRLSIRDQGMGIPEDELETVFDKFIQSSKTRTGAGGTGLGLAICREIVEAHQGRIRAENNPQGGAVFHVVLPHKMRGSSSEGRSGEPCDEQSDPEVPSVPREQAALARNA